MPPTPERNNFLPLELKANGPSSCLRGDPVDGKAPLHVIDEPEVLSCFLNLDNVHEAGREAVVSPNFAVDFDQALFEDPLHLVACLEGTERYFGSNEAGTQGYRSYLSARTSTCFV